MSAINHTTYRYALETSSSQQRSEQRLEHWRERASLVADAYLGIVQWTHEDGGTRYTIATDSLDLGHALGFITVEEQCQRVRENTLLTEDDKRSAEDWYRRVALDGSGLERLRLPGLKSREEAHTEAAYSIADLSFQKQRWKDHPALVSKDGGTQRPYEEGEEFNSSVWDLVPDAWDHEHCAICGDHICGHEGCGHPDSFINAGGDWVCPPCFDRYLKQRIETDNDSKQVLGR